MRKFRLIFLTLLFSCLLVLGAFAEDIFITEMQTVVLPRDVFVGDEMEIRCTFSCDVSLLPENVLSSDLTMDDIPDMTVKSVSLQRAGSSYMLSMLCIPWSLGDIEIPPVLIYGNGGNADETAGTEQGAESTDESDESGIPEEVRIFLDVPAVTIKSIVNYTGASDLRPSKAPLLIPGTTWVIYILSIIGITVLVTLVIILIKFRSFRKKVHAVVSACLVVKNYHSLKYQLRKLMKGKKPVTDAQFADIVSHLIREYISCRFAYNFRSETPAGVVEAFERITCGLFSVEVGEAVQELSDVLIRCDYIRFSGDVGENGVLPAEERVRICVSVINAAVCLEKDNYNAKV